MKKIIALLFSVFVVFGIVMMSDAKPCRYNALFEDVINGSTIPKSAVHISIKDLNTGKTVYELNQDTPVPAASVQKIVTYTVAKDKLGSDYKFSTKLYKNRNNDYYVFLGADPFFTTTDLKSLFSGVLGKINSVTLDGSIVDNAEWGEGWQWDDELNPHMPKFSAYNIDNNTLSVFIIPTMVGAPAKITTNVFYPYSFENYTVTTEDETNIKLAKNPEVSPESIAVSGTVSKTTLRKVPVNSPKRYFKIRLTDILRKHRNPFLGEFQYGKLPYNCKFVTEIKHPMKMTSESILKKSNNMAAESFFKVASYDYETKESGTVERSIKLFNKYCEKAGLNNSGVRIVDGSGVSKNNLLTAQFLTEFLAYNGNTDLKKNLPTAGEGTLESRMLYLKDKLYAKTGTLSDISALAGYLETQIGNNYAFSIIINSPNVKEADMKMLEEYIVREIYQRL